MSHLHLVALIVRDYDPAIDFFVNVLGFELAEDSPSVTNDRRPKRWVVVRPPGAKTGMLLARADGDEQLAAVGHQFAGRVGLFLRVDAFEATYRRMQSAMSRRREATARRAVWHRGSIPRSPRQPLTCSGHPEASTPITSRRKKRAGVECGRSPEAKSDISASAWCVGQRLRRIEYATASSKGHRRLSSE